MEKPKEEHTLANIRCTCMSFEPNCFTGSCRKCGFLPKEEPFKHEFKVLTKEEVMEGRSSAYEFIDFDKQETLEEAAWRKIL